MDESQLKIEDKEMFEVKKKWVQQYKKALEDAKKEGIEIEPKERKLIDLEKWSGLFESKEDKELKGATYRLHHQHYRRGEGVWGPNIKQYKETEDQKI